MLSEAETDRIDAVRGFLCFYVFCFHLYSSFLEHALEASDIYRSFFHQGFVAVQIFFALSGFLIFHSFAKASQAGQAKSLLHFFVKRFFRIFPVWFVVLLIHSINIGQHDVLIFFWNFFFLFGLHPFKLTELTALHSWSLYVEEIFYLSFPIFIYFFRKRLIMHFVLVFLALKVLFYFSYVIPAGYHFYTPLNCFHYFAYGIICYLCLPYLRRINFSDSAFFLCLALVTIISLITKQREALIEAYVTLWFIFIIAGPPRFTRLFNFIFKLLGRYCFSFYLAHLICIEKASIIYDKFFYQNSANINIVVLIKFGMALFLTLIFALLLYYLVELPCIGVGRKLLNRSSK